MIWASALNTSRVLKFTTPTFCSLHAIWGKRRVERQRIKGQQKRGVGCRYKYLEQQREDVSLPLSPKCLLFSFSPPLKIYWEARGEMDRLRGWGSKRDGGVCHCLLKGKEHLDSLSWGKTSHVSLFFLSLQPLCYSVSYTISFPVNLFLISPLLIFLPFHIGNLTSRCNCLSRKLDLKRKQKASEFNSFIEEAAASNIYGFVVA